MRLLILLFVCLYYLSTTRNAKCQASVAKNTGKRNQELDYELEKQQIGDQDSTEIALFESYSNGLRYILQGMFGSEYESEILKSNNTANLPLCSANEQMIDKGCNVMMYSCTSHIKDKYLCYFYYWSFCRCSRPWSLKFLNYIIPPIYDCYPSVATDDDFLRNQEFMDESRTARARKESKFLKTLPEGMEIPVGKCGLNFLLIVWTIISFLILLWASYRVYLFVCYVKANIITSRKNT